MNAFVKKEIRLLLPNFGFACVLALAGLFYPSNVDSLLTGIIYFAACIFCPAVAVMLALSSFGVEVSSGTLPNLLAQPMPRLKIWETKIMLLAGALLAVAFLWVGAFLFSTFYSGQNHGINDWLDLASIVSVFGLVVFSGGLWTVLLLRQAAAAFWFTLLVPGVILMIVIALCGGHSEEFTTGMVATVLGLYSLTGFFLARWLFLRAQDVQWSGGAIVMPEMRGLARFKSAMGMRTWRPRAALWRKEFMLHQSQFVMAFVLLVLHLGVLAARHFLDLTNSRDLKFTLEIFWGLWFVMPLLVGCAAVAEERKLGTLEGQLCLPVKRRTQFAIKFFVVMFLSVVLGAVMPLLLEGARILPVSSGNTFAFLPFLLLPILLLIVIAILIGAISFYVSSLARNTLQTLAPAVLGLLLFGFLLGAAAAPWGREYDFLWRGPLAYFIAVPLLLLTLLALAFWNFQQVRTSAKMGGRNLLFILFALVLGVVATTAVYHRGWEKFTALEPPHGTAKLSLADDVQLNVWWAETNVRLPDGRIWTARFGTDDSARSSLARLAGKFSATLVDGQFYRGSNWASMDRYGREIVGIKTDGTLWISEMPKPVSKRPQSGAHADDNRMRNLVQFGEETNWCSVSPTYLSALLVKTDGTLWRLGTNRFDEKHNAWPGLRAFTPYRLGTDSGWKKTSQDYYQFTMQKTNGSIWISLNNYGQTNGLTPLELEPGFAVAQLYDGKHGKFRSTTQIQDGLQYKVGIREDGTFRLWADMSFKKNKKSNNHEAVWAAADFQFGGGTNWLALAGGDEKVVTLKSDGTLWLWDFKHGRPPGVPSLLKTVPVRLGTHSDWLAVSGHSSGLVALAADGSLWFWPVENAESYYDYNNGNENNRVQPLLDISRKPQWLGNVFGKTE